MGIKVTHDNYTVFDAGRFAIFIGFKGGNGKGGEGVTKGLAEGVIFCSREVLPCFSVVMEAKVFFSIVLIPEGFVSGTMVA